VDDIAARPPHNYGEIIPAAPTCDQGDWSTQICQNEGCGSVNYIKFEGATGHAADKPATCTTPSRCTKCNDILVRALGHSFTEWEIVVEATEINNGIKRRYCLTCGEVEETKIAATGTIEAIEFNDYMELLDLILGEALGVDSGEISFTFENPQDRVDLTAKIMKLERGYRMAITGKREDLRYEDVTLFEAYYDNGIFVFMQNEDGDAYAAASELENLIPAPIEVMKDMLEQLHGLLDDYVRGYLAEARAFLDEYSELLGDDINAALAAAEIPYTVDQLGEVLRLARIRVVVGEVAVDLRVQLVHGTAERAQDAGRGSAGDAVAGVDGDRHRPRQRAVADDARALLVRLVGRDAQLVQGEENAALNGLEAVLHARQRTLQDDMLRVGNHGDVHDLFHRPP
jgi:hypothetical protein